MWIELGTMVLATLASLTAAPGLGLNISAAEAVTKAPNSCQVTSDPDSCLDIVECDLFIASSGAEFCGLACDARSATTCEADGACELVDGTCEYPASQPVGC